MPNHHIQKTDLTPFTHTCLAFLLSCTLLSTASAQSDNQSTVPPGQSGRDLQKMIQNDAGNGPALPNYPLETNLNLKATTVSKWKTNSTLHLFLNDQVNISIGSYTFDAEQAVVLITPRQLIGRSAHQVEVYLHNADSSSGSSSIQQQAKRLLVTALIVGNVNLTADQLQDNNQSQNPLVQSALKRIEKHHQSLQQRIVQIDSPQPLYTPETLAKRDKYNKTTQGSPTNIPKELIKEIDDNVTGKAAPNFPLNTDESQKPSPSALVDFNAASIVYQAGEEEDAVLLTGGIQLMYIDAQKDRRVTLTADRAVIFLPPNTLKQGVKQTQAVSVTGIYLEDNVVMTNGDYTLRGPRIYYDLANNKALVLQAVFYTWDPNHKIPIYVRAQQLRQESDSEFSAKGAQLTTSEFHEPHFAIGVSEVTIKRERQPGKPDQYVYDAKNVGLQANGQSLFYWPSMKGDTTQVPLRSLKAGYSKRYGGILETRFDLFTLANADKKEGVDGELLFDTYTKRGVGIGIELDYDVPQAFGDIEAYFLYDQGKDEPGGRQPLDPETENRGRVHIQHRHYLPDDWELSLQLAWLSDPTFLEEFYRRETNAAQEYETSIYLKKQNEDEAFTFYARQDLIDFIPQNTTRQSSGNGILSNGANIGTTTQKLPEIEYYRIATPFWDNRLTWYSENRASAMRLDFPRTNAAELGFSPAESIALFGIASGTNFDTALRGAGLDQETRYRLDSRQEIQAPLKMGTIDVVPFVAMRATVYDDDFGAYAGEMDNQRFWGAAGVRFHTQFSRTYNDFDNRLFDLNRIRHIIEPHVSLMYAETDIDQETLPVYDYDVESIAAGYITRFGVRQTFQTQRGTGNRLRSVDFLTIDTDFVISDDATVQESAIARYVDYRPEFSLYGDHFFSQVAWQVSDSLSVVSNFNHSFETEKLERWNTGFTLQHNPRLSSFIQVRSVRVVEYRVVRYGVDYLLTPKYHAELSQSVDLKRSRSRDLTLTLTRRMPKWLLFLVFNHDSIDNDTSVGIALSPEGFSGRGSVKRNPFAFTY